MRFDTKIAIVVRADLAAWQKLNVTAFLASGVATAFDETIRPALRGRADLPLAGIAVYGARNAVDKVCKGLMLHP